jgi:hypothetical protein
MLELSTAARIEPEPEPDAAGSQSGVGNGSGFVVGCWNMGAVASLICVSGYVGCGV